MRVALAISALLMASASADARDYAVSVKGQLYHVLIPDHCHRVSCVSIAYRATPENSPQKSPAGQMGRSVALDDADVPMPPERPRGLGGAPDASGQVPLPPRRPDSIAADKPARPAPPSDVEQVPVAPTAASSSGASENASLSEPRDAEAARADPPELSDSGTLTPSGSDPADSSPLGFWIPELGQKRIHIVACGSDLCGYAYDTATKRDGDRLIEMKPAGDRKWVGHITSERDGTDRTSAVTQPGPDLLHIDGCALQDLLCDGQVWRRV